MRLSMTQVNSSLKMFRYEYDTVHKAVYDNVNKEWCSVHYTASQVPFFILQGDDRQIPIAVASLEKKFGHFNGTFKQD